VSALTILAVGALGGAGAVARFVLTAWITERAGRDFPVGTLAVNVTGSCALGLAAGAGLDGDARVLVATGLLGSFTTFSTWMLDTRRLPRWQAALNVLISLAAGLAAVAAARAVVG
jgi:CrcB protein